MHYIVARFPRSFPSKDNRRGTCGMHTLKAVIEGFNSSQINNYMNYASGRFSKHTGYMFPFGLLKVIRNHGLSARTIHCRFMSKTKKIEILKSLLQHGPVILLISHAYSSKTHFSFRRAFTLQHYISLRGYDDDKRVFFVYDSNTEKPHHRGETLPVGNILLDYDRLLRYRRLGGRGMFRDFGIAVSGSTD